MAFAFFCIFYLDFFLHELYIYDFFLHIPNSITCINFIDLCLLYILVAMDGSWGNWSGGFDINTFEALFWFGLWKFDHVLSDFSAKFTSSHMFHSEISSEKSVAFTSYPFLNDNNFIFYIFSPPVFLSFLFILKIP